MKRAIFTLLLAGGSLLAADGAALYKKCIACHGAQGTTKALGKGEVIKGKSEADLIESMKAYKEGTLNKNGMGSLMKAQLASYSLEDIEAVANYIASFK